MTDTYWEQAAALRNFGLHQQMGKAHRYVAPTPASCIKCTRTAARVQAAFDLETVDQAFAVASRAHSGYLAQLRSRTMSGII